LLGILLIDKPIGITSHDVVNQVRRRLQLRRVGHAGTLDPLATGLLVVAVGPATRFLQYLPLEPKTYVAEIQFGQASTTYDAEGDLTEERPVPDDLKTAIKQQIPRFHGLIEQLPPMFSAVKVKGQPLYKYARQGKPIEREMRTIHIDSYDLIEVQGTRAKVRIVCSGGTYIRTLAHDLGEALGCGAHLVGLIRTDVGRFSLDRAKPLDDVDASDLLPLSEALFPMTQILLDEDKTAQVREGRPIGLAAPPEGKRVALLQPNGEVFSIASVQGNLLQPECVIPAEVLNGTL
jgi:tRNA pseudouridine55 synthase